MKKREIPKRARWPKELIMPTASDFHHGSWVHNPNREFVLVLSELNNTEAVAREEFDELVQDCGTRCCLVGWACVAFGEDGVTPDAVANPATAAFLNKFIELAGHEVVDKEEDCDGDKIYFVKQVADAASEVFEGCGLTGSEKLSAKRAEELWVQTAAHFGYTEDA